MKVYSIAYKEPGSTSGYKGTFSDYNCANTKLKALNLSADEYQIFVDTIDEQNLIRGKIYILERYLPEDSFTFGGVSESKRKLIKKDKGSNNTIIESTIE